MNRIDLNDIRLLMQVVESGSYTAASRLNGVPKSTISQRIAALERAVGTGLLRRTSRSFSLTEAGALLLPHARDIEALSRKIEQQLFEQGDKVAGTLRVSCSNALSQFALAGLVPRFLEQHDGVAVRVEASNRIVDIVSEGYDMALRGHIGDLRDSILLQRVVARTPWSLSASPIWIRTNGMPAAPGELQADRMLYYSGQPGAPVLKFRRGEQEIALSLSPRLAVDDMVSLRDSAAAGGGIACLPDYISNELMKSGRLLPVLPEWSLPISVISVLTPPRAQSSRLTRLFSDFLAKELPGILRI